MDVNREEGKGDTFTKNYLTLKFMYIDKLRTSNFTLDFTLHRTRQKKIERGYFLTNEDFIPISTKQF